MKARQIRWLGEVQTTPVVPVATSPQTNGRLSNIEMILLASVVVSAASLVFNIWNTYREHLTS